MLELRFLNKETRKKQKQNAHKTKNELHIFQMF
jgi:hypothetical protein